MGFCGLTFQHKDSITSILRQSSGQASTKNTGGVELFIPVAGVLLRVLVFTYMGFLNNDNHLEVVEYFARHGSPPRADQFNQAYHPPLYYYWASLVYRAGGARAVHALSLVFSIATILMIFALLRRLPWITDRTRPWLFGLAAFQPQLIMYSLFISNDTLAIFLGAALAFECRNFQQRPGNLNLIRLAFCLGLGLLTKATFIAFLPAMVLFVVLCGINAKTKPGRIVMQAAGFTIIACLSGCYKYVENLVYFGNPLISNLDLWDWTGKQRPTWIGIRSLLDFNLLKLLQTPIITSETAHSWPLMLYGSFWYSFIPDSTFHANLAPPFNRLGALIYAAALCPTVLMIIGWTRIIRRVGKRKYGMSTENLNVRERVVFEGTFMIVLLLNLLLILAVGWKYDVWSVFQGRLLLPAYVGILLALNAGLESLVNRQTAWRVCRLIMAALFVMFVGYFAIEIAFSVKYPGDPRRYNHMPYELDMRARK